VNRISSLFGGNDLDPESRSRFLLIGGMVAIVAIALVLIVVGYYVDRVAPRGDTVFQVGERKFSYDYLEDRVNAANALGSFDINNVTFSIAQIVADIQNEELVRLIAREDGISLTDEEIDAGLRRSLGVRPEAAHNTLASSLRARLQLMGLSYDRYSEILEADLLEQKIQANIQEAIPAEIEQVDLHIILVGTDSEAAAARQRIVDGEAFEDVATEVSQHASAADGGELGWTPGDTLVPELAEAVFAQEIGTLSDVIETERGFYIARVDGREERELTEDMRFILARTYFGERLQDASERYELQNLVTIAHAQRIANQLRVVSGG
jgi:parvulin-like peptidyl-prolyl isomerase